MVDLNILVRGQSNALLFVDYGGAAVMESEAERILGPGVNVHIIAAWPGTIWSGTAFLDWDTDGEQADLMDYVRALPADLKDNPTVTLWMHNEADGNRPLESAGVWSGEVRADAVLFRQAIMQDAQTTPYLFTYIPYAYSWGGTPEKIQDGMRQLAADASFNARTDFAATQGIAMDGGPEPGPGGSHMGRADAQLVGQRLGATVAGMLGGFLDTSPTGTSLTGTSRNDRLVGAAGADTISGLAGNDTLEGEGGNDRIIGGSGGDGLKGGLGADRLTGSAGIDSFFYGALNKSPVAGCDTIIDFSPGAERINVSAIDPSTAAGDQAFTWRGTGAFTANGVAEARYRHSGANTIMDFDTGTGGAVDMSILLRGTLTLASTDLVL